MSLSDGILATEYYRERGKIRGACFENTSRALERGRSGIADHIWSLEEIVGLLT
jgi:hypothetical protein